MNNPMENIKVKETGIINKNVKLTQSDFNKMQDYITHLEEKLSNDLPLKDSKIANLDQKLSKLSDEYKDLNESFETNLTTANNTEAELKGELEFKEKQIELLTPDSNKIEKLVLAADKFINHQIYKSSSISDNVNIDFRDMAILNKYNVLQSFIENEEVKIPFKNDKGIKVDATITIMSDSWEQAEGSLNSYSNKYIGVVIPKSQEEIKAFKEPVNSYQGELSYILSDVVSRDYDEKYNNILTLSEFNSQYGDRINQSSMENTVLKDELNKANDKITKLENLLGQANDIINKVQGHLDNIGKGDKGLDNKKLDKVEQLEI
ncbi:hypothetical protein BTS2_3345 [Bacillus sp. TS-2]|nr:hypothetical protein BTS2_3345 [Bacillus sp. TS-2]